MCKDSASNADLSDDPRFVELELERIRLLRLHVSLLHKLEMVHLELDEARVLKLEASVVDGLWAKHDALIWELDTQLVPDIAAYEEKVKIYKRERGVASPPTGHTEFVYIMGMGFAVVV